MEISVHEATVNTATVEIKTLMISGKQVTLSVFRQIPEESPFSEGIYNHEDISALDSAWGTVNYCPGHKLCHIPEKQHYHFIWQKDSLLRRWAIAKRWEDSREGQTYRRESYDNDLAIKAQDKIIKYCDSSTKRLEAEEKKQSLFEQRLVSFTISKEAERCHPFFIEKLESLPQLFIAV